MWLFTKDSTNAVSSLGLGFSSDPVAGFTFVPSSKSEYESFVFDGPYGLQWRVRRAQRRKTTEEASIFTCSLNSPLANSEHDLIADALRQTVKWMKTLRHPNILNWLAGTEFTGSKLPSEFHIATESVLPLREYLRLKADSGNFNFIASWGLHQVSRALAFLNDDAKMAHNAVRMDAIFVTSSGEWKLGGLDFVGSVGEPPQSNRTAAGFSHPTQTGNDPYLPPDGTLVDSWGLGCLIWEIFNPECTLRERSQLTATSALQRLPKSLVAGYRRLVAIPGTRGVKKRITVAQFLSQLRDAEKDGFFANQYVNTLLFLEEIQLKDSQDKSKFLSGLSEQISNFPDDVCRHKVLPHLLNDLRYGSAGVDALIPILRIIPLLTESDFEATVLPCLVQLFASPERATRVRLLEQLPNFVQNLPSKVVESQIFPPVSAGFSDANPLVREATVRAMIHLAPKLTGKLLNETLPRYIIALQTKDDQGGIRTNATVCLAKLASYFSTQVQQGVMLSAFLRVTRDPFTPSRRAAVASLAATQGYYTTEQLACKLLPCLSFLTLDPEKPIRDDAFRTIRGIIELLEQISEDPSRSDVFAKNSQATSTEAKTVNSIGLNAASTLSQWAFSALKFSSRLITSGPSTSVIANTVADGDASVSATQSPAHVILENNAKEKPQSTVLTQNPGIPKAGIKSVSARSTVEQPIPKQTPVLSRQHQAWSHDREIDDEWGSLEADIKSQDGVNEKSPYHKEEQTSSWDWNSTESNEADGAFFDSIPHTSSSKSHVKPSKNSSTTSKKQTTSPRSGPAKPTKVKDWDSDDFFKQVSLDDSQEALKRAAHRGTESKTKKNSTRTAKKHNSPPRKSEKVDDSGWDEW
ncbi:N terminal kinase protein like [Fasciola hepatica]|uniref:N-terminal kinase-like protein n=1 Tax=Fasciola hepatica TaxID=6192 RepID=A0A4E0RX39_FASHE|nr:N terminal kinase protein like [Fasciola hepatica]